MYMYVYACMIILSLRALSIRSGNSSSQDSCRPLTGICIHVVVNVCVLSLHCHATPPDVVVYDYNCTTCRLVLS